MSIIINDDYKAIDTTYGKMIINRHEFGLPWMLEKEGEWVPTEIEFLMQFAKGFCVDIGANIGTHTLAFARQATYVWSFEPQQLTYYTLCSNLLLNNVFNAMPLPIALGNYDGMAQMWTPDPRVRNASAGIRAGQDGNTQVFMRRLDSFNVSPVHFIKIDVEGAELEVLQGAQETLKKHHPIVYVEVHKEELIDPICALMDSLGFRGNRGVETSIIRPDGDPNDKENEVPLLKLWGYLFMGKDVVIG